MANHLFETDFAGENLKHLLRHTAEHGTVTIRDDAHGDFILLPQEAFGELLKALGREVPSVTEVKMTDAELDEFNRRTAEGYASWA